RPSSWDLPTSRLTFARTAHCVISGGGGIRTHGTAKRYIGFRDRPFQPLRHPSGSPGSTRFSLEETRRSWKKRLRISPHSFSITPAVIDARWFRRGSEIRR